jgi:hypothetical protein
MILLQRTLFVTEKATRSGSLFLSDGQYVGSPIDRYVGTSHGNLPHVGNIGNQVTLRQIGIQATLR